MTYQFAKDLRAIREILGISQEEFELLWKTFGFYIYKFNAVDSKSLPHLSKFKMHFIYFVFILLQS